MYETREPARQPSTTDEIAQGILMLAFSGFRYISTGKIIFAEHNPRALQRMKRVVGGNELWLVAGNFG
jgi:hypothetical protein